MTVHKNRPQALERILAEDQSLFQTLINHLPDYIYVKDMDSRFVIVNVATVHLLGAETADEIIGKRDFDFFPPELAVQYYADEQNLLKTDRSIIDKEEVSVKSGLTRYHATTKVAVRDKLGNPIGLIGISRDITDRKQIEDEKRRLFDTLSQQHHQLRALALRLAEAQEAEQKRVVHELHHKIGRNLTLLESNLKFIRTQLLKANTISRAIQIQLTDALALVEQTNDSIDTIVNELSLSLPDDDSLDAVLRWYAAQMSVRIGLETSVQDDSGLAVGPLDQLSSREMEVLQLVAEGGSSVTIAERLHLSPKTVDTYRFRIMQKLNLENIPSLVKFAIRHGLTPLE